MDFKVIRDAKGNLIEDVTLEPYTITKSDNEKDIESVFKNYIEFVGWKQGVSYTRDRDKSSRYKFRNEHKGSTNGKPDYIFYDENDNIIALCDTKSTKEGVRASIEDGKEYIRCLKEDYSVQVNAVIGFDGVTFLLELFTGKKWEAVKVDSQFVDRMPSLKFLKYIINSKGKMEEVAETENIDRNKLNGFFKATDEIIRRSPIGSSATDKFIELSTIIFLKMFSIKDYDKQFFESNSKFRYRHIWDAVVNGDIDLVNNEFSNWLNVAYKNIYRDDSYQLLHLDSLNLIRVAKLVDRIFATYELSDFTNVKGDILEYFQESSKDGKIGEFFTPRHIIKYMIKLIEPTVVVDKDDSVYIEKIYDPTCGTGGFLIEAFNRYKEFYAKELPNMEILKNGVLHGTELKANTALLAKMNMILIGDGHTNITQCDAFGYDKIEKFSKAKDAFGHYIPVEASEVSFYYEANKKQYYVKGDKTRKVSLEPKNKIDFYYDDFGEKIVLDDEEIQKKDGKAYDLEGLPVKRSKGVNYKGRYVQHYEYKIEEKVKYEYKNVRAVNPVLKKKKLENGGENACYQENFGEFDVVLANQPFGLSEPPKADYLFIRHMLESLHDGRNDKTNRYGRIACIVDNGFLHDSKYFSEREKLQKEYTIRGIISLPQKVFAPYVKTIKSNILLIEKRKPRVGEKTYFVKIENDGYSLDDKRVKQIENDDFKILMSGLWNKWDDTVFVNQETGKKTYVDAHAEKKGFAEYHMLNAESWAVSNYIRYIVPEFEYNMVFLAPYIHECNSKRSPIEFAENGEDIIQIKGVSKKYGIIVSDSKKANEYNQKYKVLPKNVICYNPSRVNTGSIAVNKQDEGLISPSYIIFKVNEEAFLQDYIVYFLKSEYGRRQIEDYNNGTVRNSLSFDDLGKIQIPHMTIDEQRRLVDLISNTTFAKVKLLDSYNSILKVGIPESSFAQFNTEFEEIELGKLIVEDEKPTYGCSKKSDDNENGYSILKMNNIYPVINEDTLGDEIDRVSLTDVEIEKYVLHKDDILVNRTNSLELVGKTGLFDANTDDAQKYVFASYIMRFHLLEGYSPKYIAYYMNLSTVKMKIKEYAIQS